jgi:hypothetical protein
MRHLKMGRFSVPIPTSRVYRLTLGTFITLLGFLGFLPILGFWMIPLGLVLLSMDIPSLRRLRRRTLAKWRQRKQANKSS